MYYYGARWYDPTVGRFLAADTIVPEPGNPGSLNRYSYVLNNSLKYIDPTGHANEATGGVANLYAWAELLDHSHSQKFHGWLHERDSAWANYLIAKREGAPPEVVSVAAGMLEARQNALLVNGYRGVATAQQTAFESYGVDVGTGMIGLAGGVTSIGVVGLKAAPVQAGEAGGYAELKNRGAFGDDLEAHHMPQKALRFTSPDEGGALMLPKNEHAQTRTYGQRGALTVSQDAGKSFREVLAADIWDIRSIVGSRYNQGLQDLIDYYRSNFPTLMWK